METTTERKAVEAMTVPELKTELQEADVAIPSPASQKALRERVAAVRAEQVVPAAEDGGPVEPTTPEGMADALEEAAALPLEDVPVAEVVPPEETALVPPEVADEVGAALALREKAPQPTHSIPTPQEFNAMQTQAIAIASTGMVPESYRGRPDDVLAAFLFGRELGMGLMTALRDIYMIEGRPALAAHRQLGQIRRGGVTILESEATDERARILARRSDTGEVMDIEFTMEEAQRIKRKGKLLVDGDNWRSYPRDMLWARCVGRLTRRLASDLIGGLPPYVAEEVADFEGWGVEYGTQGEVRVGRYAQQTREDPAEPIRKEYPEFNIPKAWPELLERLGGRIGNEEATEWIRQMTEQATGSPSIAALPVAKRRLMFQKACLVLARIEAEPGDLIFDNEVRRIVAEAFAPRIDGVMLEGPPWRLGPTEEDRPTLEEWKASQPPVDAPAEQPSEAVEDAEWKPTPEEEAEADGIEFGGGYGG